MVRVLAEKSKLMHSHVTSHGFERGFISEYLLEENAPYIVGQDECRTLREKV